jgi:adenosylcobinamide-phosphate synthase
VLLFAQSSRCAEQRLLTLASALLLDACWGEPPAACHPVVGMGWLISFLERRLPRGTPALEFASGTLIVLGGAVPCVLAGVASRRLCRHLPLLLRVATEASILKTCFALRALDEAATAVGQALERRDLASARARLTALVSRDASALDESLVTAAAIESVAENLSDSVIGPWLWYWFFGLPGALAYRYLNTCDAMLGYRGAYEYLGKCSARLDDLAGFLPARTSALLLVLAAFATGASASGAWRVLRRDHISTASPNAGWPMSAMAGALTVRLEKVGHYVLGDGGALPSARDICRALRLCAAATALAVVGLSADCWQRRLRAAAA